MKTLFGFNVANVDKLNKWHKQKPLDIEQLMLMRWFLDFSKSNKMKQFVHADGEVYSWVSLPYATRQFQVLDISSRTIRRKFKDLCQKRIMRTAVLNKDNNKDKHGCLAGYAFYPEPLAILSSKEHACLETQKKETSKYHQYLLSDEWKKKRDLVVQRDQKKCTKCGSVKYLNVHHLRYDNIFNEPIEDLVTLCRDCHQVAHGIEVK